MEPFTHFGKEYSAVEGPITSNTFMGGFADPMFSLTDERLKCIFLGFKKSLLSVAFSEYVSARQFKPPLSNNHAFSRTALATPGL